MSFRKSVASHTVVTNTLLNPVSSFDLVSVLKTPNDLLFGACSVILEGPLRIYWVTGPLAINLDCLCVNFTVG